jgi:hypothetical protein
MVFLRVTSFLQQQNLLISNHLFLKGRRSDQDFHAGVLFFSDLHASNESLPDSGQGPVRFDWKFGATRLRKIC